MARWQISIDDELAEKIDAYSKSNFMSRSAFLSFVSIQFLNADSVVKLMDSLDVSVRKIADSGALDEKSKLELADISATLKVLSGK